MPRLCTGCGLTTDDEGNLIAAVSGGSYEATYPDCGVANGGKVYCSTADGKLYVDPTPMYREWRFVNEIPTTGDNSGELTNYGINQSMDFPTTKEFTASAGIIKNPSNCRPMQLFIEIGIQHALFTVDSGGPDANDTSLGDIQIESYYTLTGDINAAQQPGGHQHWGAEARGGTAGRRQLYRMDSSGAFLDLPTNANGTSPWILPPGGSVTLTSVAKLIVIRYQTSGDGSVRLENWRNTIRVRGWSGA